MVLSSLMKAARCTMHAGKSLVQHALCGLHHIVFRTVSSGVFLVF